MPATKELAARALQQANARSAEAKLRVKNPDRPRIYDISLDAFRYATQEDFDRLQGIVQAYGRVAEFWRKNHRELGEKLNWPECNR